MQVMIRAELQGYKIATSRTRSLVRHRTSFTRNTHLDLDSLHPEPIIGILDAGHTLGTDLYNRGEMVCDGRVVNAECSEFTVKRGSDIHLYQVVITKKAQLLTDLSLVSLLKTMGLLEI